MFGLILSCLALSFLSSVLTLLVHGNIALLATTTARPPPPLPADMSRHKACGICHMILLRKNIARHIRDQHTSKGRSRCPVCRKTYKTSEWLKDHMRRGHGLQREETERLIKENKAIVESVDEEDDAAGDEDEEISAFPGY